MAVLHRPNKQRYQKIVNSLTEFFELDIIDIPNKDVLKIIEESNVLSKYDFVFILGIISYREKQACQRAGVNWIFLEKAFTTGRKKGVFRISFNSYYPTKYHHLFEDNDSRFENISRMTNGHKILPTKALPLDTPVIYAGSSDKYSIWHGLIDPTQYATQQIKEIRLHHDADIIYKPKPIAGKYPEKINKHKKYTQPIDGTEFLLTEKSSLQTLDFKPRCLVAHGSNILLEACLLGIPTICLGDSPVRKISRTKIKDINEPYIPTIKEKKKVLNSCSFFEWTCPEVISGEMWNYLKPVFEAEAYNNVR